MTTELVLQIIFNWFLFFCAGFVISYLTQVAISGQWGIKNFDYSDNYLTLLGWWGFISLVLGIVFNYV